MRPVVIRTFSINKLEEYLKEEKDYRRNAPDRPIHSGVESLFSTESGFNNFRGLLNLFLILLTVSSLRMALENINNYGLLADPLILVKLLANDSAQWPAFILILYMQIFILHALLIEKLLIHNWIPERFAWFLKVTNLAVLLAHPSYIIWTRNISPFISAPILLSNTVVFLKLWSYGQVNSWCRTRYMRRLRSINNTSIDQLVIRKLQDKEKPTQIVVTPSNSSMSHSSSHSSLSSSSQDTSGHCSLTNLSTCENCLRNKDKTEIKTGDCIKNSDTEGIVTSTIDDKDAPRKINKQHRQRGFSQSRHEFNSGQKKGSKKSSKRSVSISSPDTIRFQIGETEEVPKKRKISLFQPPASWAFDFNRTSSRLTMKPVRQGIHKKLNSVAGFGPPIIGSMSGFDEKRMFNDVDASFKWNNALVFKNLDRKDDPKLYSIPTMVDRLNIRYPNNINLSDLYYFVFAPTLCYELNFPRTLSIRKKFLGKRLFELIILPQLMICLIQQWILPMLRKETQLFAQTRSWSVILERILKFAVPNHIIWLIGFYSLFHASFNVIAELMRFGDRLFYKDWWNAETVQSFWSTWNIPVHRWCRRHVYFPLIEIGFSRPWAMLVVFFISAFFHEFLASVPLKMCRCWAFIGMLAQVPYAYLVHFLSPNGGKLGNIAVWITLIIGQPLAILMYLHDYYLLNYYIPS